MNYKNKHVARRNDLLKIKQLPDSLANQIAAGEVVERPASVVKELMENSIDAGSTWIKVQLHDAGIKKIQITDNGEGMDAEDCERAFLRHATSKINRESDLFHVRTLGFRGEALASIASVSKLSIRTSPGDQAGTFLYLEGGKIVKKEKWDARQGTDIIVEHLFYNTPARLKYLKTIHTELGHVTDVLHRIGLANPSIRIEASHNGKKIFQTSGKGDMLQVISQIYGHNVAKQMIPVQHETLDFTLNGYISKPEVTRANRSYISLLVNCRYIRSIALSQAILRAYHTLLPIHRFPIVVLSISMDPILVDVNVHPTKLEVRFSKEKDLSDAIQDMIQFAFREEALIPSIETDHLVQKSKSVQSSIDLETTDETPFARERVKSSHDTDVQYVVENDLRKNPDVQHSELTWHQHAPTLRHVREDAEAKEKNNEHFPFEKSVPHQVNDNRIPPLYVIGQLHGTYILAQNDEGLYMIDQHAAQERINYERYKEKLGKPLNKGQDLLLPLTFEFTQKEALFIESHQKDLEKVGLFFEPFGLNSYVIRSYPTWFPKGYEEETIREMVEQIIIDGSISIEHIRDEAAILMACKGSIKANEYLTLDDMNRLIEDLRKTKDPFTCPHGRPIIVHISSYELEKMFKRVM